jgi:hypothetical protein
MKQLIPVSILVIGAPAAVSASWEVSYPHKLTEKQNGVLVELCDYVLNNQSSKTKAKDANRWRRKLKSNGLPPTASAVEIEDVDGRVMNKTDQDRLIVIAHVTGDDIAVRAHWLKPKERMTYNKAMGSKLILP